MTTAYTSLLGLALPVTGELNGTWGDTVNNYITQYTDAAVAGAQTISGSQTAVTLSVTTGTTLVQAGTGTTGSSQYQIINCTGSPAGLLTITAPAASKVYLVLNSTSTSQSVKVVGAGPTTGVTVATGKAALIAWNGSDFALVASTDASKLTGILAVANGGTGLSSGTSGGIPYFSGSTTIASSAALAANAVVLGGGAGVAPATTTTGTGVVTALGQNVNGSSGGIVLGTAASLTTPALDQETFSTSAAVAAGTNAQGQGPITSDYNVVTTAASSPSGITLPTATTGRRIIVVNKGANAVNVYPAIGAAIDASATNAAVSLPVSGYIEFNASSGTQWYSTANIANSSNAVTSFSAGTTGLTPSTASTGAVTLSGTLGVTNGGTGLTTLSSGHIPYGQGTSPYASTVNLSYDGSTLRVGNQALLGGTTNPIVGMTGSANGYIQGYIYNQSNSAASSSDFVAYASGSTDTAGWADLGFTSPTFSDAAYTVTGPNEAYVFGSSTSSSYTGNLVYATDSTGSANAHQWYVGGFAQAKGAWKMQLGSTGLQLSSALGVAYGGTGLTAGTSGGVLYYSATGTLASSAALAASSIVLGGGAGAAPATTTTGTGVVTAIGNAVNNTSGLVTQTATLTASALLLGGGASTGISSTTTGTGVVTAIGNAVNTAGGVTTIDGTATLTNKRITPRVLASTANSATPTLNTDSYDMMVITGQSVAITSFTTNLTGTPTNGQKLWISITGTGAIAITWGASFESSTTTLPTTTVTTARLDVGFVWNVATSKWRCVAVA